MPNSTFHSHKREFKLCNTMCLHINNLHRPRILKSTVQILNIEQPLGFYIGVFYSHLSFNPQRGLNIRL